SVKLLSPFKNAGGVARGFRKFSQPLWNRRSSPKYAGLLEYGGSYEGAYLLRRGMFMPWELPEVLDPDVAREGLETLGTLGALASSMAGLEQPRARIMALEMAWY